jgi:hypothetical protein
VFRKAASTCGERPQRARQAAAREAQGQQQAGAVIVAQAGEGGEPFASPEQAEGDQAKQRNEGEPPAVTPAGVGQFGQDCREG